MDHFSQTKSTTNVFAGKTVLIMDENDMLRQVIGEIFQNLNCQVLQAADEHEALAYFQQNGMAINLILLEVDTPYVNGEAVYRHVQDEALENKTIILTSCNEEAIKEQLDRAIYFLRKPFSMHDLIDRAQTVLLNFPDGKFPNQLTKG